MVSISEIQNQTTQLQGPCRRRTAEICAAYACSSSFVNYHPIPFGKFPLIFPSFSYKNGSTQRNIHSKHFQRRRLFTFSRSLQSIPFFDLKLQSPNMSSSKPINIENVLCPTISIFLSIQNHFHLCLSTSNH